LDGVGDPVGRHVDDADGASAIAIRREDVRGVVSEGDVADRRADPHLAVDAGGFGVDDDELTAADIRGGDIQPLAGGVDGDGVDGDAGTRRDVDGADALSGGGADRDVDGVVTGP